MSAFSNSEERVSELRKRLNPAALMQQASEETGLQDFGDEVLTRLEHLTGDVAEDVNLSDTGVTEYRRTLVRILVNKLRIADDLKRHPEILEEDVSDPIIILGLPRSGTTKTQRMMGADPHLLKLYMYQALNPAAFPRTPLDAPDPRIAASKVGDILHANSPQVQAGHRFAAEAIDGDAEISTYTLNDWMNINRTPSRLWHDWVHERKNPSDLDNFRTMKTLYQYMQWQNGGRRDRLWLIKNVNWMSFLPEIVETFPKATLVHVHRDPLVSVPSVAKLMVGMWGSRLQDLQPEFVAQFQIDLSKHKVDRYIAARDRLGLDDRIIDVDYDQIRSDPMPAFREIYARAGRTLTPEGERAMLAWERDNEQGKHGAHTYSLAEFGLSEDMINEALAPYIRRFIKR